MVETRSDLISESFSLRKRVQNWSNFCQSYNFFKVFLSSYMSAMVETRSDQISQSFSFWKRVQNCSDFHQKLRFLKVFSVSYMSAMAEARSFQSLLVYESEFKIAPILAKSYNFWRSCLSWLRLYQVKFQCKCVFWYASIYSNTEVVFNLLWNWGCLPLVLTLRSSSIFQKIEVFFHFPENLGRLPFSRKFRSSSIFKKIEVVFHFPKSWGPLPIWVYYTPVRLLGQHLLPNVGK